MANMLIFRSIVLAIVVFCMRLILLNAILNTINLSHFFKRLIFSLQLIGGKYVSDKY